MMTRDEYESKLAELERQLAELKEAEIEDEKPYPPHPRWKPEIGGEYWYMYGLGAVHSSNMQDTKADKQYYEMGNMFPTRAEAEFAAERLRVIAEMREWAGGGNDTYILCYNHLIGHIAAIYYGGSVNTYGMMRFATREDAENCIKAVGADRIKKYYFEISEE